MSIRMLPRAWAEDEVNWDDLGRAKEKALPESVQRG